MENNFIQKTFWGFVLVGVIATAVLFALVCYSFFLGQQRGEQAQEWKVYASEQRGFSLEYPANVDFTEYPEQEGYWIVSFFEKSTMHVVFSVSRHKGEPIIFEPWQMREKVNVGGIEGQTVELFTASTDKCYQVLVYRGDLTYTFDDGCQNEGVLFDQMLSTFKFTK